MSKYHVALSFAGEDRKYVEAVAKVLKRKGIRVFYDDFEAVSLWGKDLYAHLTDVYQNQAMYTVIFVSKAYARKAWTNLERRAAQARAFSENLEYILPAVFDTFVEIPGVLKTTGRVDLSKLSPQKFAQKIIQKLESDKVALALEKFSYSSEARADVDFPLPRGSKITKIVDALRSLNWYTQNPAIDSIFKLDWDRVSSDEAFVLGRNIYQAACGNAHSALDIVQNLRKELSRFPHAVAEHLLNGMFYEAYFDSKGEFRGPNLKKTWLAELFTIQTADKFKDCVGFIGQALAPYRDKILIAPSKRPEVLEVSVRIKRKAPVVVKGMECLGQQVLVKLADGESVGSLWKLSHKRFDLNSLRESLAESWAVPKDQLRVTTTPKGNPQTVVSLPDGTTIGHPLVGPKEAV